MTDSEKVKEKQKNNQHKTVKYAVAIGIIIALLLLLSIGTIIILSKRAQPEDILMAYVYRDNEVIMEIDISKAELNGEQLRIDYGENDYNIIEVRDGSIGIADASCPDHLCMNMGYISSSLMPITCLPNHLIIKVEKKRGSDRDSKRETLENGMEFDGVVY